MSGTLGMLYLVDVKMIDKATRETIKQRLLVVGGEEADISRKISWVIDASRYRSIAVIGHEKIRDKVHVLHTVVEQAPPAPTPVIERGDRSESVPQAKSIIQSEPPKLFAIGVTTTMVAQDSTHALRKVGHAILSRTSPGSSHAGASLSDNSTISVEQIPFSSGYAKPRDVSNESNHATFVRG